MIAKSKHDRRKSNAIQRNTLTVLCSLGLESEMSAENVTDFQALSFYARWNPLPLPSSQPHDQVRTEVRLVIYFFNKLHRLVAGGPINYSPEFEPSQHARAKHGKFVSARACGADEIVYARNAFPRELLRFLTYLYVCTCVYIYTHRVHKYIWALTLLLSRCECVLCDIASNNFRSIIKSGRVGTERRQNEYTHTTKFW